MSSVKATIRRGDEVLSGEGAVMKPSAQRRVIDNNERETAPKKENQGPRELDMIVQRTINMLKTKHITLPVAANIIVGRIRVRFVNAIRRNKENSSFGYEITSFKYLDEILFNDLSYIICSTVQFGSAGSLSLNQVMKMIVDTSNVIEYYIPEDDYEDIKNILGAVYNEF